MHTETIHSYTMSIIEVTHHIERTRSIIQWLKDTSAKMPGVDTSMSYKRLVNKAEQDIEGYLADIRNWARAIENYTAPKEELPF